MDELPVLDLRDVTSADDERAARFVDELREVVHTVGFFHLVGHGVDPDLLAAGHRVAAEFFARPDDDRFEIDNVKSPQFRGYTRFGHEHTNGRADLRDQIDIGREQPEPTLGADHPAWLVLRGPNLWPAAVPEMRPVMTAWMDALEPVGDVLLRTMSQALGQPAHHFDDAVTPPEVLLKVIRYRTPDDASQDSHGVGAHRDTGFLTFVHQNSVGGLQVEHRGEFVDVPVRPDAFVVNIGEMLQLVTHGYFRATVHRVLRPSPGAERISIAYFYNPKLEATLAPVDLPADLAADAPGGESADAGNPILANYGDNSLKVRLRAHPDVAQAHHAELLATGAWASSPR
ncbi:2-oxoglutarate and iron-dependent oxygenase domain-containing protein [soil metagenome]